MRSLYRPLAVLPMTEIDHPTRVASQRGKYAEHTDDAAIVARRGRRRRKRPRRAVLAPVWRPRQRGKMVQYPAQKRSVVRYQFWLIGCSLRICAVHTGSVEEDCLARRACSLVDMLSTSRGDAGNAGVKSQSDGNLSNECDGLVIPFKSILGKRKIFKRKNACRISLLG